MAAGKRGVVERGWGHEFAGGDGRCGNGCVDGCVLYGPDEEIPVF